MTEADKFERMALWAERKADEAAESPKPWALRNLRFYQNYASKWWGEHYKAKRERLAPKSDCGTLDS